MWIRLALVLVGLWPVLAQAAVDCADAGAVAQTYAVPGSPTEITSYTRPSGSDFVGFAVAGHRNATPAKTVDAMTWAGNAMTATTTLQYTDPVWGQLFHIIAPPSGAQTVVMDWNVTPLTDGIVIFVCTGVNQSTPTHDPAQSTGTGTTASTTVSNVTATDVVIACVTRSGTASMTGSGSLVVIANDNAAPDEMNVGCWYQPGSAGGSVSVSLTSSSTWTIHAVAVASVPSGDSGGEAIWFP